MRTSPIIVSKHKLGIIKFEDLFLSIEKDFLNDLILYDLLKNNKIDLRKKDTKKLIYHHLIFNICEEIIKIKKKYKVDVCITYDNIFSTNNEICSYIDCDLLYDQLIRTIKIIESKLYIIFYKLNNIKINNNNLESGEIIDILNLIITKVSRASTKKNVNFSKIQDFIKKYELKFLNEKYFSQISCHYLLI